MNSVFTYNRTPRVGKSLVLGYGMTSFPTCAHTGSFIFNKYLNLGTLARAALPTPGGFYVLIWPQGKKNLHGIFQLTSSNLYLKGSYFKPVWILKVCQPAIP